MDQQAAYIQVLSERYPDLPIHEVDFQNQDGQYNDILIVNQDIVFRFPKYAEGVQRLQEEVQILRSIQGLTTLPVPNPVYTSGEEQRLGKVFMGYTRLPGEPLWRKTLQSIVNEDVLQRLAGQLAGFLKELHQIPLETLGPGLPVQDSAAEMTRLYAEIRQYLFAYMRPDARERVTRQFEAFQDTAELHAYPLVLKHGDFGGSNILYDQKSLRVTGIIDFGFAGPGDPAQDIAAAATFGETFLERFIPTYPEMQTMMDRARFYKSTFALSEACHGIKSGDQAAFEAGIASYR